MRNLLAIGLLVLVATVGCSTTSVGQVVTNVSADGRGGLLIQKGTLKQQKLFGLYNTDVSVEGLHTTNVNAGND